jgi:hypothetical protein
MKCSQCEFDATYTDSHRRLCDKHYRIQQMRQDSLTRRGVKHTRQELEDALPEDMKCPKCKVDLIWRRKHDQKGITNQITIQHWDNGSVGFLCHRCNTQHGSMDDESFKVMPLDHKFCPCCKIIKHESTFGLKNSRSVLKRNSHCLECCRETVEKWRVNNVHRRNEYARKYREERKAAGNPIFRKKPVDTLPNVDVE